MLTLTDNAVNELKFLRSKWDNFKAKRHVGKFGTVKMSKGYLTVLEREQIIDDLFDIYKYQTEDVI